MGGSVVWVEFDGVSEFLLGAIPIPVIASANHCERDVGFGEGIVESEGFFRGGSCLGEGVARRGFAPVVEERVGISQAGIGECEVWIRLHGLFEVRHALYQ